MGQCEPSSPLLVGSRRLRARRPGLPQRLLASRAKADPRGDFSAVQFSQEMDETASPWKEWRGVAVTRVGWHAGCTV